MELTGSERSGTRWANSTITTNLIQYDRQLNLTVRVGDKVASAFTRDFSDNGLKEAVTEALTTAKANPDTPNLPAWLGAQTYIPVDAALPAGVNFGPRERAMMVKASSDICEKRGVLGSGYIPKTFQTDCTANTKGLFAYYSVAETGFILTCRMPDGSGSGWAGTTGIKDPSMIDPVALTDVAVGKALKSRNAQALEPGRYTVILEPRANARFLSLLMGIFNAPGGLGGPAGGPGGGGPGGGGGGGLAFMRGKNPGDKILSDLVTLRSEIGNPILRQTTMMGDNTPAAPTTWVEKGVLRNLAGGPNGPRATTNMSLLMDGSNMSIEDMVEQTKRGLLIGDLLAQSPGRVLQSRFKGLADIALAECKSAGCSYYDIRFTRTMSLPGVTATAGSPGAGGGRGGGGGGGGGGRGGGGRGGGRGGGGQAGPPNDPDGTPRAAVFGVRVIHGGVWGFASSPIVSEDEIRRIAKLAVEVARASAIARKVDVKLAPVPPYQVYWRTEMTMDPMTLSATAQQSALQAVVDAAITQKDVIAATASANYNTEWKYFASSEGSYIEQDLFGTSANSTVTAKRGDVTASRSLGIPGGMGGWELVEADRMRSNVDRLVEEAHELTTAKPITPGIRDLVLAPSHLALTIHEIVAHATELDRIVGYEANYAGTSFVKVADIGKLKYGSKLMNVTGDKVRPGGRATVGYDDDGVKTTQFPIVRDGILVGVSSNRETAHYIGDKESRGCTQASSWRDYPFLRMPNVHLDAGPKGSPTPEEILADTKDGVLIEGSGSFSIDQQRYNGQFGGSAFWEVKNGKKTRAVTNVTYNAITTDFWGNMNAISGPESWQQFGVGGDAKRQPTQGQAVSHGAPWIRIGKIMVGAAFQ